MDKKSFQELGLSAETLKAVSQMGFEEASPIQAGAIPLLLQGRDVVGLSQTGSGKTAAFAIPAIESADPSIKAPQILILCPTRELALQVAEETAKLAQFKKGLRELPIYGGQSYDRQLRGLKQGAQIIIGTPGRIMDHLDRRTLALDSLRMVVLDEADRMLDMGFLEDIQSILAQMPATRQTVLFSATMPRPIRNLIQTFARDPAEVRIEGQAMTVPAIDQIYYEVDRRSKLEVLCRLIDMEDIKYAIIFCTTKMMVDELTEHLIARGYAADKMHGDMTQSMRERVMGRFRKRAVELLVATDVAARGLDVKDIEVVFNYDLPHDGEDYVHRIGRTGRAGSHGRAITFVAGREIYRLQNIIRFTGAKIRRERVPSLEQVEEHRANVFFETLRGTLERGDFKRRDDLMDRLLDQGYSPTDILSAVLHLHEPEKPVVEIPTPRRSEPSRNERDERPGRKPYAEHGGRRGRGRGGDEERPGKGGSRQRGGDGEVVGRLVLSAGRSDGISAGDILGVIVGAARLKRDDVGFIKLHDKESVVDIRRGDVAKIARKLDGIQFKKQILGARVG